MSTKPKQDTPMGQEIRRLREQRGWSLSELAKRGGIARSYLFQIEHGQCVPTIGKFWKLAHALGVSMEGLFTGDGDLGRVGTGDRVGAILAERQRQDEKWGANRNLSPDKWVTILAEECGEVARAVQGHDMLAMRDEAVHVAAVALAIVEWVEREFMILADTERALQSWVLRPDDELPSRASLCGSDPNFTGDILDVEAQQ